ncbi:hypothetical protein H7100_01970, partial [Candidatus Saccharibacteria bacterium]|nr:hypothetical protein [Candidatus Saccharibacteria bacterium]
MSPSAKGTRHVSENSNPKLGHEVHINSALTIDRATGTSGNTPETPEKKKSLKQKLLIGGAGLTLAAVVATGIGFGVSNSGEKPPVATETSAPAEPTESPAPTEVPAEPTVAEFAPYAEATPEALVKYEQMPFADFEALQKSEQALYVSWLTRDMEIFVAEWQDQRMGVNDTYTEASKDNTAQQAIAFNTWLDRIAVTFNTEDAKKILTFGVESKNQSALYDTIIGFADVPNRKPRAMAEGQSLPIVTVTSEASP